MRFGLIPLLIRRAIVLLLLLAYRAFGKPGFLAGRDLTLVGSMILVSLVVFWVAYKGASWASEEIPAFPSTWWRFLAPVSLDFSLTATAPEALSPG